MNKCRDLEIIGSLREIRDFGRKIQSGWRHLNGGNPSPVFSFPWFAPNFKKHKGNQLTKIPPGGALPMGPRGNNWRRSFGRAFRKAAGELKRAAKAGRGISPRAHKGFGKSKSVRIQKNICATKNPPRCFRDLHDNRVVTDTLF